MGKAREYADSPRRASPWAVHFDGVAALSSPRNRRWREREGVEPTVDTVGCPPSDLKSGPSAPDNKGLLEEFLQDRRARGLSPQTLRFYHGYLALFVSRVNQFVFLLTKHDLSTFLDGLSCGPGGKHAYFRAIRAFYRWALEDGLIERSPTDRMKAPKVPKPIRHTVPLDAVPTLMAACIEVRDKLIISLLADTGVRRSELAAILVRDIDASRRTIKIWGKGAMQRLVVYGPTTAMLMADYLPGVRCERLFTIAGWGVEQMLKRLEKATGIKCNAHAFRRTFATKSVRNGMNLFYVQSLLGHSSLTMTRIYAEQVNSEDAIKAYKPIIKKS